MRTRLTDEELRQKFRKLKGNAVLSEVALMSVPNTAEKPDNAEILKTSRANADYGRFLKEHDSKHNS
jgi:hypothetical protein